MSGTIPPFPNTTPWRGAQLKHRDNFTFTFKYINQFRFYSVIIPISQYNDGPPPEDKSRDSSRNFVCIKYISNNG
jgi:hypothetical protein